jgi:hypothetical protein
MTEMMDVGANNSEIMFDSMLVGPFHFRVAKGPSAETWQACVEFSRIESAGRISIAGMNNLLRSRDKLERKLNDKPLVVCIQYYRHIATGNRW